MDAMFGVSQNIRPHSVLESPRPKLIPVDMGKAATITDQDVDANSPNESDEGEDHLDSDVEVKVKTIQKESMKVVKEIGLQSKFTTRTRIMLFRRICIDILEYGYSFIFGQN